MNPYMAFEPETLLGFFSSLRYRVTKALVVGSHEEDDGKGGGRSPRKGLQNYTPKGGFRASGF